MLVNAGANLELRDGHGNTPLGLATMSYRGGTEVISTLLEAGANPDAENKSGISPRALAIQSRIMTLRSSLRITDVGVGRSIMKSALNPAI